MLKKIISTVLLLCLIFSVSVMAENNNAVNDEIVPEVSGQILETEQGDMGMPSTGEMPTRGTPSNMPNGEMPPEGMSKGQRPQGNFTPPENFGEFTMPQGDFTPPQNNNLNNNTDTTIQADEDASTENPKFSGGNQQFGGQIPEGMSGFFGNMQGVNQDTQTEQETGFLGFVKTNSTPIISVILLGLAYIFVALYKRKNY